MWKEIVLGIFITFALVVFIKLSQLKVNNRPIIKLGYRILISLLFPVLFVISLVFGSLLVLFVFAFIITIILLIFIFWLFGRARSRF